MKFIWQEGYDQMKSIVSRCWLEPNGHGLPPAFTSVLAGCQVGLHRVVYSASVDELGKWHFPEFQGDEEDVTVLFWMPKPDVSLRVDTGFAFNADMMEAILFGVNRQANEVQVLTQEIDRKTFGHLQDRVKELESQLADAIKRAEAAEKERDRLALQVRASSTDDDDLTLSNLQEDTNDVLDSLDKTAIKGAINWADLRCVSAEKVHDKRGREWFRVEIEEAAPGEEALIAAVAAGLTAKGWYMPDIEIATEW